MSNTKLSLRLNGYSADNAGIICDSGIERFKHERIGVLRIVTSRDTREARALVDVMIAAIDEPRACLGRDRRGGVVMLFRAEQSFSSDSSELSAQTITLRSGEEFILSLASQGATVEIDAFTWLKNRSPLDVSRDALPPLAPDFVKIAYDAAWAAGARSSDELAREREADQFRADLASGKKKFRTEAEIAELVQAQNDAELVAAYAGTEVCERDGNAALLVIHARRRHAARHQGAG